MLRGAYALEKVANRLILSRGNGPRFLRQGAAEQELAALHLIAGLVGAKCGFKLDRFRHLINFKTFRQCDAHVFSESVGIQDYGMLSWSARLETPIPGVK